MTKTWSKPRRAAQRAYGIVGIGLSVERLLYWALGLVGGAVLAWGISHLAWFWQTFQLAVVIIVGITTWLLIGIGLNLFRHARADMGRSLDPLLWVAGIAAIALISSLVAYSLKAREVPQASIREEPAVPSQPQRETLVSDPHMTASNEPGSLVTFYGTFSRGGPIARVFLDFDRDKSQSASSQSAFPRRVKLADFKNFVRGDAVRVAVVSYETPDSEGGVLRWGSAENGPSSADDRFTVMEPSRARIAIVGEKGNDLQHYSFMLLPKIDTAAFLKLAMPFPPRPGESRTPPPALRHDNLILVTEDMLDFAAKWK
jgi:hypothetical protein